MDWRNLFLGTDFWLVKPKSGTGSSCHSEYRQQNWTKSERKKINVLNTENTVVLIVNTIACEMSHMQLPISIL
jgi:hypothetical protein